MHIKQTASKREETEIKRLSILVLALVMLLGVPAIVGAGKVASPLASDLEGKVSIEVKVLPYAELSLLDNIWVTPFSEPGVKSNHHWFNVWTNVPVKVTVQAVLNEAYNNYFRVTLSDTSYVHGSTEYDYTFSTPGKHSDNFFVVTEWLRDSNWWEVEPDRFLSIGALVYTVQAL